MKKNLLVILFLLVVGVMSSHAQHVRVRLSFPVGISINAHGPRPYPDAIWIGPEWQWRGGRYECVPGYWARPHHHGAIWIPGHWRSTRRGEMWEPGHWR